MSVHELERNTVDVEEIQNTILRTQGECEHFEREIDTLESEADSIAQERQRILAQTDSLRRQGESKKDEVAQIDKEIAVAESEIVHNNVRIEELNKQIALSEQSDEQTDTQIAEFNEQIKTIQGEITQLEQNAQTKTETLKTLESQNSELDSEHREIDRVAGQLLSEKTAAEIHISRAEKTIAELQIELDNAQALVSGQEDERVLRQESETKLKKELALLAEDKIELQNKLSGYSKIYENKTAKLDNSLQELETVRKERATAKTRLDVLADVERSMSGYYSSVKAVMQAAKSGRFGDKQVTGTVADVIKVEREYSTAVEIALGSALQHVIVANESVAKRCIGFLKESKAGRATFLPLTSVNGNTLDSRVIESLDLEDGFIGIGHDIIDYAPQFEGIVKSLLGRTAFAEDIDCATAIAKKFGFKFRIVTLDGQVINAGGSFTGGSVKKSEGIIGRKQELEELKTRVQALSDKLEPAKATHDQLAAECAKMKLECEGFRESLTKLSGEELRITAELNGVSEMLRQFDEQLAASEATLTRNKSRLEQEQQTIDSNKAELERIESELSEKEALAREKSSALESLLEQRKEIAETLSDTEMQRLTKSKDIESLQTQIANLDTAKSRAGDERERLNGEIASLEQSSVSLKSEIEVKRQNISQVESEFKSNKQEVSALVDKAQECEKRATEINNEIREKTEHKTKFSNAYAVAIERKTTVERKSEEIIAALYNDYELSPSEARELVLRLAEDSQFDISDMKEAKSQRSRIKKELEALGSVNFTAIDEFTEVSERYKVLSEQLSDVRASKSELEKLIAELIQDIRARFLESFNEIAGHFSRIFKEIFGGGEARLELTDSDDVLKSGIEIYAAPPGKIIKSLTGLSGGEKALVAITLYLAILMHRPTPFCMLDEVDAALDELNVTKYIKYLRKYSDTTQLMMITHRRPTIEGCDVLYGVFMQEKGVSRLLKQEVTALQ